ncbi:MAG: hypothetical protein PHV68_05385 [Candidatus Gastranaerophilales bacterium]|nr:hypothetical protein [Candidatus Gastranaerophilales bacterium]
MTDINKNFINHNGLNIKKTDRMAFKGSEANVDLPEKTDEVLEAPKDVNLDLSPGAILGKSQIKPVSRETYTKIEDDMAFLEQHPQLVSNSNKIFENAYDNAVVQNSDNPYAKAASIQNEFVEEFAN